jgi:type I restriction enzyme, S subunit
VKRVGSERLIRAGDVLVNSTGVGTLGPVAQLRVEPPEATTVDSHITIVRPDRTLFFLDFFGYMMQEIEDTIKESGEGASGQTELSRATLSEKFLVRFPESKADQQRIAGILDEAFEGVATANADVEKNLQNARALFESHLQSVFTRRSDEVILSDLATDITDGDHTPPPKAPSGIPFITISDIVKRTREIDFSNTFTVPTDYFQNLKPNKKPRVGDVLYTVTGATLGIPVLVKEQRDFCFQRHIGLIRPKPDTDSAWLTYALLSPQVFSQATVGSTGAAQKTVSLGVLRSLKVPKIVSRAKAYSG